ncbi:undecaprenyl-phosphate galactose phosphotransferase [Rhizomicrobium palustre]|uniref:Undecaprenyl-phosphate galactose phosphotransferase n=1 Tax=Rhizomicrobium palustre TaxID=189966 RepID=A0A846N448_9PROT|nr:exopolysaccharide biosynthesis polyprenyl glycosylphosphotransferase [Rhizomicrobium palustre]NIK89830.1 undecaprenyl-phosphate galactose phosphotransferase [Rhizomicrobium palustre]
MNIELRPSVVTGSEPAAEIMDKASTPSPRGAPHSAHPSIRQSLLAHPGITTALFAMDFLAFWGSVALSAAICWMIDPALWNGMVQSDAPALTSRLMFCLYYSVGVCVWSAASGAYSARWTFDEDAKRLVSLVFMMFLIDVFVEFAAMQQTPRLWVITLWPLACVLILFARIFIRRVLDAFGVWRVGAAILGSGERYGAVMESIETNSYTGYYAAYHSHIPVRRDMSLSDFARWLSKDLAMRGAETAILVPSASEMEAADRVIDALNLCLKPYILVPPVQRVSLAGLTVQSSMASDAVLMSSRHGLMSPLRRATKRVFDVVVSLSLIIFMAPALAVIAAAVASSGWPILYGHERIGRGGKPFRCLKFRTMVVNSDEVLAKLLASDPERAAEWRQSFKLTNDPRITRIGKFLRETSLDELPQLINVLRGDMSLVGPRPVIAKEIKFYYGEEALFYELVRPGVTGLWQVSGRSETTYSRRVFLDSCYVRNWSLWADVVILFSTIPSVLAREGAR